MESIPDFFMWILAFLPGVVLLACALLVVGFVKRSKWWGIVLMVLGALLLVLGGVATYSLKSSGMTF